MMLTLLNVTLQVSLVLQQIKRLYNMILLQLKVMYSTVEEMLQIVE